LQRAFAFGSVARCIVAGTDLRCRDRGEWQDGTAIALLPEGGMGNVVSLVRVQSDGDLAQLASWAAIQLLRRCISA
jgi:hypothetical protein